MNYLVDDCKSVSDDAKIIITQDQSLGQCILVFVSTVVVSCTYDHIYIENGLYIY